MARVQFVTWRSESLTTTKTQTWNWFKRIKRKKTLSMNTREKSTPNQSSLNQCIPNFLAFKAPTPISFKFLPESTKYKRKGLIWIGCWMWYVWHMLPKMPNFFFALTPKTQPVEPNHGENPFRLFSTVLTQDFSAKIC